MAVAIWEMVKEAIEHFDREVTYAEIKQYVREQHGDINDSSLTCAIIASSVNHASRIHYQENKRARVSSGPHDFLFNTGRGRVAPYVIAKHGQWEIYAKDNDSFGVRQLESLGDVLHEANGEPDEGSSLFALESHLRDYMAKNLTNLDGLGPLSLHSDNGRDGVEFQTDVGPIDILARDEEGNFVVFELKLGRGPDACLGQVLRYMGWVQKHLADAKSVRGVIVASDIPLKLKYAVTQTPHVSLMEYQLSFSVSPVSL